MKTGYDRFLEYQFRQSGDFFTYLFRAILQADKYNLEKLAKGFPEEVDAYREWAHRGGAEGLLAKCSPDHGLVKKVKAGELIL